MAHSEPPVAPLLPVQVQPWQGSRSGLVTRAVANVIDLVVMTIALLLAYLGAAAVKFFWRPRSFTFPHPSSAVTITVGCVAFALYLAVCWATGGRTYGDLVLGLRVVNRKGARVHALTSIVRAALCVAFPIGLLWVAVDRGNRSLQDLLLRTQVIYDWPERLG